ncbi:MAG: IclR family transcriptional regulator C-terminal domain-containing protein [Gammaproteobacteria bacterium]|nr:IclR family transcriptional regulator C-terminal domain-containing protein [Gammaproteobacteria bacterium]
MNDSTTESALKRSRRRGRPVKISGAEGGGQVQSLSRALGLLEHLAAAAERGISLTDLARRARLAPSTTHRLLATLEKQGFAELDTERGLWFVGVRTFVVGNAFLAHRDFVATARPFMRQLMEESGESVNLGILDEGELVFLSQVECREMMRMFVRLGARVPAHASGVGKALLAALSESEVDAILEKRGLQRFTDNTIDARAILRDDFARVRERGYAFDDEEHAVGLRCVASTLHDELGEPIAAISLSGPRARITDQRVEILGRLVRDTADRITRALGGQLPVWRNR